LHLKTSVCSSTACSSIVGSNTLVSPEVSSQSNWRWYDDCYGNTPVLFATKAAPS